MVFDILMVIGLVLSFLYIFYSHNKLIKKEKSLDEYISLFICNNIEKIIASDTLSKLIEKNSAKKLKELKDKVDLIYQENKIYKQEILKLNNKMNELHDIIKDLTDEKIKLKQENKKLQTTF